MTSRILVVGFTAGLVVGTTFVAFAVAMELNREESS